jgi:hypothetical protein
MVVGFTMINVLQGHEDEAYLALTNTKGVKDVIHILGEYHLFVIMHAENEMLLVHAQYDINYSTFASKSANLGMQRSLE